MNLPASLLPKYSYQDYKLWKEDWELINGYPYSLIPLAKVNHNKVQVNAIIQSGNALKRHQNNCNCLVFSELDWKINEKTVVRPDVMIVCGEPKTDFLEFPPVLILKILSSSTRVKDRNVKFELYREQGVKYYLMADYEKHTVEVYELMDNTYREVQRNTFLLEKGCEAGFDFNQFWD